MNVALHQAILEVLETLGYLAFIGGLCFIGFKVAQWKMSG